MMPPDPIPTTPEPTTEVGRHRPECIWTGVPVSECGYCPDEDRLDASATPTTDEQDAEDIADSDGRLLPRGLR